MPRKCSVCKSIASGPGKPDCYSHPVLPATVKCAVCKETIVSKHRHDFVVCGCGSTFVDGGTDYCRTGTLKSDTPPPVFETDNE